MDIQIIQVPYDSAQRNRRMGSGPGRFIREGLEPRLRERGCKVYLDSVEGEGDFQAEIKTAFELNRALAERVSKSRAAGRFPFVLSGNCNSSLGTIAGADPVDLGVVWFDGHGDFNTPETTTSGFLDGMGLATAVGLCWKKLAASIPGFTPVEGKNVIHIGIRDYSEDERRLFRQSGVAVLKAKTIRREGVGEPLNTAIRTMRPRIQRVYLHFDLDVLDPQNWPANEFAPSEGLTVEQVIKIIEVIGSTFSVTACGIASFDPTYDPQGKTLEAGMQIIEAVMGAARV
jgi:arginase